MEQLYPIVEKYPSAGRSKASRQSAAAAKRRAPPQKVAKLKKPKIETLDGFVDNDEMDSDFEENVADRDSDDEF